MFRALRSILGDAAAAAAAAACKPSGANGNMTSGTIGVLTVAGGAEQ